MKITCATEYIREAVITTERFTGRHITLPILSYILFDTKDKKLSLHGTNLETGIEYTIPGKVQRLGTAAAPAKHLSQILQSIHDDTITIEAKQHQLTLSTTSSEVTIIGLNPSDFPTLPVIQGEYTFRVSGAHLREALGQVLPAVATSDLKPELAGVFIAVAPGTITFTATDSFRLAEKVLEHPEGAADTTSFIVPSRTIHEVLRSLPETETVMVTIGEHQVVFEWAGIRILSRLIDGTYPPYQNLFPKTYETSITVEREAFLQKIRLAAVFSSRLNDVTLKLSSQGLEVSTANTETGTTTSRLPAKVHGQPNTVVFNYRYLLDGVETVEGREVLLNANGAAGPTLIQGPSDSSYRYLLMPIRSV